MNNTQWKRIEECDADNYIPQSLSLPATGKYVNQSNQLLSLVPDNKQSNKVERLLRRYCRLSCEFVDEVKMEETNKKYLCRIFGLDNNDKLLLSYPLKECHKKYIEKLAHTRIELEKFDYFMECDLSL
ncbi:MAG: hypothetical protein KUG78_08890 [Kangiellaceae bacterium]|nr:hypothetical protein [Kangiellaceae bacterium]